MKFMEVNKKYKEVAILLWIAYYPWRLFCMTICLCLYSHNGNNCGSDPVVCG